MTTENENDHVAVRKLLSTQSWEALWAQGVRGGECWDKEGPLPEFAHQVATNQLPKGGTALIPGCGRAYDVQLLSRSGLFERVVGVDISETAVNSAKQYLTDVVPPLPNNYDVISADFFTGDLPQSDLVFDYTFFCALPPARRQAWADRMTQLVPVGGCLITVMFPCDDRPRDDGPPFPLCPEDYEKVLGSSFVPRDGPRQLEDSMTHPDRGNGRTQWCRWERV